MRRILREVDLFLAPSQFLRHRYVSCGVPPEKIVYARYGMRPFARVSRETTPDRIRFGYIGAFYAQKGVEILLEAFQGLGDRASLDINGSAFGSPISESYWKGLSLDDLSIPNARQWRFAHPGIVAVSAVKPYLLQYLLDRGYAHAVFIDADVLVLGDLAALLNPVFRPAVMLTPHFAVSSPPSRTAGRELRILRAGVFNGGCIGINEQSEGRRFLDW